MKATTFHSFKGWETRLLVVYIANFRGPQSRAAIYAAFDPPETQRTRQSPHGSLLGLGTAGIRGELRHAGGLKQR